MIEDIRYLVNQVKKSPNKQRLYVRFDKNFRKNLFIWSCLSLSTSYSAKTTQLWEGGDRRFSHKMLIYTQETSFCLILPRPSFEELVHILC